MSNPDLHPDLVGLLRGELPNSAAIEAADHLRGCPNCPGELVEVATGHALLRRASSTLGQPEESSPAPPPIVMPDRRPRRPRLRMAAAAAAVLVVGIGLGTALGAALDEGAQTEPGGTPSEAPLAVDATLAPVEGAGTGAVQMSAPVDHSTDVTVSTSGLPAAPRGGFYYVWLLDPDTNKMLPLGLVGPGGTASFRIDSDLVASYGAVDVSLEADDGDPAHSITSVLRGTYDMT